MNWFRWTRAKTIINNSALATEGLSGHSALHIANLRITSQKNYSFTQKLKIMVQGTWDIF